VGRDGKGMWGWGRREKGGEKGSVRKPRFVDGSHDWGQEGRGDCGRVVIEESIVSVAV